MEDNREARLKYYEGVRRATLEQFKATEDGIRNLVAEPAKIEKLIADLQRRHERLLKRLDRHIEKEKIR